MKNELTAQLNIYLANISVMYTKLHNLHWNVVGSQFKAAHEYLETLYNSMSDVLDSTAELLKMNGETPLASMKDYLAASTIQELDSSELEVSKVLQIVLEDMEALKVQAAAIRSCANGDDQFDAANKMENDLENYSKTIWFIRSMLK